MDCTAIVGRVLRGGGEEAARKTDHTGWGEGDLGLRF